MTQPEQWKAWLEGALGEQVVQFTSVGAAGQSIQRSRLGDSGFWRPHLTVNGQPHTRVPTTMFLVLTPTRLMITGMANYAPDLNATILTLQRGDAEIIVTARPSRRKWTYSLRSRASGAELEVELDTMGYQPAVHLAEELATQLSEFSVAPTTPRTADGTAELGYNRRSALKARRRTFRLIAIAPLLISLGTFSIGAYHVYAYSVGTPTKAEIYSCSHSSRSGTTCSGIWTINGESHRGYLWGDLGNVRTGSSVEVHVFHGKAYATAWESWPFLAAGTFFGIGLLLLFFGIVHKPDV
jgi:hypothetical protein